MNVSVSGYHCMRVFGSMCECVCVYIFVRVFVCGLEGDKFKTFGEKLLDR